MHPLGMTRTAVRANHALIAPDSHVATPLPGWEATQSITLISPQMQGRPQFTQFIVLMAAGAKSAEPLPNVQRFVYLLSGVATIVIGDESADLQPGYFAYLPPNTTHQLTTAATAKLLLFEKKYQPNLIDEMEPSDVLVGDAWQISAEPFLGDDAAQLRTLLPTTLEFDMAINVFTFQPGAALPFVETHVMEHGLYLLEGQGIYRLDEQWYPIQAGDAIWMGAYSQQWFCAIGERQSSYIYYKNINRDPLQAQQ